MGNYGMRIAQKGVNVLQAGDNQLLVNSLVKLPNIVFSGQKTITSFGSNATIFKHDLKFVPVFMAFVRVHSTGVTQQISLIKANKEDLVYKANDYSEAFTVTY